MAVTAKGGSHLAAARQQLPAGPMIPVGEAATTVGGALRARYVIHTAGPAFTEPPNWPIEASLRSLVTLRRELPCTPLTSLRCVLLQDKLLASTYRAAVKVLHPTPPHP
jgi:hypothetical protein